MRVIKVVNWRDKIDERVNARKRGKEKEREINIAEILINWIVIKANVSKPHAVINHTFIEIVLYMFLSSVVSPF